MDNSPIDRLSADRSLSWFQTMHVRLLETIEGKDREIARLNTQLTCLSGRERLLGDFLGCVVISEGAVLAGPFDTRQEMLEWLNDHPTDDISVANCYEQL